LPKGKEDKPSQHQHPTSFPSPSAPNNPAPASDPSSQPAHQPAPANPEPSTKPEPEITRQQSPQPETQPAKNAEPAQLPVITIQEAEPSPPPPPPPKPAAVETQDNPPSNKPAPGQRRSMHPDEDFEKLLQQFREGKADDDALEEVEAIYLQLVDEKKRRNTAVEDLEKLQRELEAARQAAARMHLSKYEPSGDTAS
jgi:hypothetical protein